MINHRSISTLYKSERGKNEWTARMEEKSLLMFLSSPSFCLSEKCYNFFFPFRCHRFNRNWMEKNVLCWIQVGGEVGQLGQPLHETSFSSSGGCCLRRMSAEVEVGKAFKFGTILSADGWLAVTCDWPGNSMKIEFILRWCDMANVTSIKLIAKL